MPKCFVSFIFEDDSESNLIPVSDKMSVPNDIPEGAIGYYFTCRNEDSCIVTSGVTYFGKMYSLDEFKEHFPENGHLAKQIHDCKFEHVVVFHSPDASDSSNYYRVLTDEDSVIEYPVSD